MQDATNELAYQLLGRSILQLDRAYWAVKLESDEWLCEARTHVDLVRGVERPIEWYDDLVANGDCLKIKELWLLCPPNALSPLGNTARLPIVEPGTAFDFKVAGAATSDFVTTQHYLEAHIIGRVDDKVSGACTCFIWDERYRLLCQPYVSNVHKFGRWRENLPDYLEVAVEKAGVVF